MENVKLFNFIMLWLFIIFYTHNSFNIFKEYLNIFNLFYKAYNNELF